MNICGKNISIHLDVDERFKLYLKDIENWNNEFDTKETALYKPDPNFNRIDWIKLYWLWEPFNTYLDNSLSYGRYIIQV